MKTTSGQGYDGSLELQIEQAFPGDSAYEAALRHVLGGDGLSRYQVTRRIDHLRELADRQELKLDLLMVARRSGRLVTAVLAIESPGNTALVYLPSRATTEAERRGLTECLTELKQRAWQRGNVLLQALLNLEDRCRSQAISTTGFRYLAELIYMDRNVDDPVCAPPRRDIEWLAFDEALRPEFVAALDETYLDSLDCPNLTGLRNTDDVLRGHQATGVFDPQGWFLARINGEAAGVLLTSRVAKRSALEIVYMGVCQRARRQGVGNALLHRAVAVARGRGLDAITLAVDSINEPARRLYERWRFLESARRRAWIAHRNDDPVYGATA